MADGIHAESAHPLKGKVDRFPTEPGVYLMKGARGVVLYVGKATNLRNRVRSYVHGGDGRPHIRYLMAEVSDIEFSLTANPRDALILEDTLIKKFRPKYNIRLRDDKTYLSLRFDLRQPFPRLEMMRRPRQDGAQYFGPFSSAAGLRRTVDFINRNFPLRTCNDTDFKSRTRPCLQHQIKRCLAPCVGYIDQDAYSDLVAQVVMVLEGKNQDLVVQLLQQMNGAAEILDFEQAAALRDRLQALKAVTAQQQVVSASDVDRDIIGFHREADEVAIAVIPIREGRMQDNRTFVFSGQVAEDGELLETFVAQRYGVGSHLPREILLPMVLTAQEDLEAILRERAGKKVVIRVPRRGDKTRLIDLAGQTARAILSQQLDQGRRSEKAASELQKILHLPAPPLSLECFDISNFQGTRPVASKVRFENGVPAKEGYRRYRIKTLEERPNDYAMMREVLARRIRRGVDEGGMPDLLVVDGGKGHLNVAIAVLRELEVEGQRVIGFAKPDAVDARSRTPILIDKIFLPGRKNPIILPPYSPALRMLQALRDESHRFAITYHRSLRRKGTLRSALQDIPGVGAKRRRLLLKEFGSVKRLKEMPEEAIAGVDGIGPILAAQIWTHLHTGEPDPVKPPEVGEEKS